MDRYEKIAGRVMADESMIDPIDVLSQYTADIARELLKLRRAYGWAGVRQNYKGTGSQRAKRQLFIRLPTDEAVDVWLETQGYQIGGVTILWIKGNFPYNGRHPAEVAKEIAEKLKMLAERDRTASDKKASITAPERLKNALSMIQSGGRGTELGIREIEYLAKDMANLSRLLRQLYRGDSESEYTEDLIKALQIYL